MEFNQGVRLEIMIIPDLIKNFKKNSIGFSHIAFSAGSKEKVEQLTRQLSLDGYNIISYPRTTGDGYYESVIEDPDGNSLEITE